MNCPKCFSIMTCQSEIHNLGKGITRMDLHCFNRHSDERLTCPHSHFGVLCCPDQEWICDHYNLPFVYDNKQYILRATPSTPSLQWNNSLQKYEMIYPKRYKLTQLLKSFVEPPIISIQFVSLSTNNDMHIQAQKLFNKLIKYVIFK